MRNTLFSDVLYNVGGHLASHLLPVDRIDPGHGQLVFVHTPLCFLPETFFKKKEFILNRSYSCRFIALKVAVTFLDFLLLSLDSWQTAL